MTSFSCFKVAGQRFFLAVALLVCSVPTVLAEGEPSAQQKRAAAEAYDRGTSAWLAGQYEQAARWFETAHRLAPSAPALLQALRAYVQANQPLRAANTAIRLQASYSEDARAQKESQDALRDAERRYTLIEVSCAACSIGVDGAVEEHLTFFVEPEVEHEIVAEFETGSKQETVKGSAGQRIELEFEPPPAPPAVASSADADGRSLTLAGSTGSSRDERWKLSPVVPIVLGVLTAGAAGVFTWSALDTMSENREWKRNPTREGYEEGRDLERRTNLLLGAAAGLGALTIAATLLATVGVAKSGEREPSSVQAGVAPRLGGFSAFVEGTFP